MKTNKTEIVHKYRFIARVSYCDAHFIISGGEAAGAVHEIGCASDRYGRSWTAYHFTATSGMGVAVITGCHGLFGVECREITRKFEAKAAKAVDKNYTERKQKITKLCAQFADAVIFAEEFGSLDADKKSGLLTNWDGGYMTFEPLQKVATKAAQAVRGLVEFVHGDNVGSVSDVFGLPYTSSGDFSAIWNTNAAARLKRTGKSAGDGLFFRGVAIEKADGKPQAVTVWERLRDGEEVGTEYYTVKELKEEAQAVKVGYFIYEGLPDYRLDKAIIKKIQAATDTPEKTRAFFSILALIGG